MKQAEKLKILIVSSEAAPFVKSGGLGDVVGSLPKALRKLGADVRVVIPKFRKIKNENYIDVEYLGGFDVNSVGELKKQEFCLKTGKCRHIL